MINETIEDITAFKFTKTLEQCGLKIELFFDCEKSLSHVYASTQKGKFVSYFFIFDENDFLVSGGCHTSQTVESEVFFEKMQDVLNYIESKQI